MFILYINQGWRVGASGAAWFCRSRSWCRIHFIFSSGTGAGAGAP